jgi:hypothetical protein
MNVMCVLLALAGLAGSALAQPLPIGGADAFTINAINGLEPRWKSDFEIEIDWGSCVGRTPLMGLMEVTPTNYPSKLLLDIRRVGLNGLDAGIPLNGQWYLVYMVMNPSTGQVGAVLTTSEIYSQVQRPSGFSLMRKLPLGVYRKPDGRFRKFRVLTWPKTHIDYPDCDASADYTAEAAGTATGWTLVNLDRFVPPGAQCADLVTHAINQSGDTGKTAYIRTFTGGGGGAVVATVSGPGPFDTAGFLTLQTDSKHQIEYMWNAPGGLLIILVRGYYYNEPV